MWPPQSEESPVSSHLEETHPPPSPLGHSFSSPLTSTRISLGLVQETEGKQTSSQLQVSFRTVVHRVCLCLCVFDLWVCVCLDISLLFPSSGFHTHIYKTCIFKLVVTWISSILTLGKFSRIILVECTCQYSRGFQWRKWCNWWVCFEFPLFWSALHTHSGGGGRRRWLSSDYVWWRTCLPPSPLFEQNLIKKVAKTNFYSDPVQLLIQQLIETVYFSARNFRLPHRKTPVFFYRVTISRILALALLSIPYVCFFVFFWVYTFSVAEPGS